MRPPEGILAAAEEAVVGQQRLHAPVVVLGRRRHDGHRRRLLPAKNLVVQVLPGLRPQGCLRELLGGDLMHLHNLDLRCA